MLREAKHLKSRPTKTPRSHPTSCLSEPRSASVRRAGAVREPPLLRCGSLQLMHSMLANPPSTYG